MLCGLVAGCGGTDDHTRADPIGSPGIGAAYSSVEPSAEIDQLAADFRGSCSFARPPGEADEYVEKVRAKETSLGSIRVRATASFEPGERENLIGEIPSGTILAAVGPIAGGGTSGIGYAVLVRDGHGRVCRGYVSSQSVDSSN